jgi:hypothetical protein
MENRNMRHEEKMSLGLHGIRAEGPRSTLFLQIVVGLLLLSAFVMGKWSAIIDACFGFKG